MEHTRKKNIRTFFFFFWNQDMLINKQISSKDFLLADKDTGALWEIIVLNVYILILFSFSFEWNSGVSWKALGRQKVAFCCYWTPQLCIWNFLIYAEISNMLIMLNCINLLIKWFTWKWLLTPDVNKQVDLYWYFKLWFILLWRNLSVLKHFYFIVHSKNRIKK